MYVPNGLLLGGVITGILSFYTGAREYTQKVGKKSEAAVIDIIFHCNQNISFYNIAKLIGKLHEYSQSAGGMSSSGTVRPDWICMRVVSLKSPLKGHQPLYVFDFLISVLNI